MNESTLTQLRGLVEGVVRTVRVRAARKGEMRDELLAHVCAVFEEEAATVGDERAALQRTAERFGDPADLTCRLQESITASGYLGWLVEHVWLRLGGRFMVNHNRLYFAVLITLGLYSLSGVGMLVVLIGIAPAARPRVRLPDWSLAPLAIVNGFYLAAVIVTLVFRLARPPVGKRSTKALNLLLLVAPPFGTALGIYGLWKVDKDMPAAAS
jgi:hypothetical protein